MPPAPTSLWWKEKLPAGQAANEAERTTMASPNPSMETLNQPHNSVCMWCFTAMHWTHLCFAMSKVCSGRETPAWTQSPEKQFYNMGQSDSHTLYKPSAFDYYIMPENWNASQMVKALRAALRRLNNANLPKMNCLDLCCADNRSVTSCANKP